MQLKGERIGRSTNKVFATPWAVVDGEAILTIPAPADKGFMILNTKASEK